MKEKFLYKSGGHRYNKDNLMFYVFRTVPYLMAGADG